MDEDKNVSSSRSGHIARLRALVRLKKSIAKIRRFGLTGMAKMTPLKMKLVMPVPSPPFPLSRGERGTVRRYASFTLKEEIRAKKKTRRQFAPHSDREGIPLGGRRMAVEDRCHPSLHAWMVSLGTHSLLASLTLGGWGYYFLAKLGMYWADLMGFHAPANLLLAGFIFWPVVSPVRRRVKGVVTVLLAIALLYHDSWLPPVDRLVSQASLLAQFNAVYLTDLALRFVSGKVIALLLLASALYWLASLWLRMSMVVVAAMLVVGLVSAFQGGTAVIESETINLTPFVQDELEGESRKAVAFLPPDVHEVPFDVIFIQVCSLSWDDVQAVGLDHHPLWRRFDMVFTKFNSAASYSGPAAIRLLRATCGQPEHGKLYLSAANDCYLMGSLQRAGFEPGLAMNHDGRFDHFLDQIGMQGRLNVLPMSLDGLKIVQYAFDDAPVYDDVEVLRRWLKKRDISGGKRAALYYNTVSLHDGNHYPGTHAEPNTLKTYRERLSRFLDGMEGMLDEMERSGRHAVVVMIPEHGGAVRGDKRQIAGLREIPTPAITLVPVGIKVVGGGVSRAGETQIVDQATSYLSLSLVIRRMLQKSPFDLPVFKPEYYVEGLPAVPFVSQNEKMTVVEYNDAYYLSRDGVKWENYAEFNKLVAAPR